MNVRNTDRPDGFRALCCCRPSGSEGHTPGEIVCCGMPIPEQWVNGKKRTRMQVDNKQEKTATIQGILRDPERTRREAKDHESTAVAVIDDGGASVRDAASTDRAS